MKRLIKHVVVCIIIFSAVTLYQTGAAFAESDHIIFGIGAPMTGPIAQYGELVKQGAELAVDEINAAGGVLGKKISLMYGDDKGDPKEASIIASKFCTNKDMIAFIGTFNSSCTLAIANYTMKYKIPLITYSSTSPKLTGLSPYVFRNIVSDKFQGEYLAEFTARKLGKKNAVILHENTDYGAPFAEIFKAKAEELGTKVLYVDKFNLGTTTDFTGILTKVKSMAPDCLIVIGMYREASLIAQQAREIGLDSQIVGGDGLLSEKLAELGGKAVEGIIFSGPFHHETSNPATQKFVEKFKAKYNIVPAGVTAQAYDAVKIVAEAIVRAGKIDREAVRLEISKTRDFDGATGKTTIDDKGDCSKDLVMLTVKDGKIVQFKK